GSWSRSTGSDSAVAVAAPPTASSHGCVAVIAVLDASARADAGAMIGPELRVSSLLAARPRGPRVRGSVVGCGAGGSILVGTKSVNVLPLPGVLSTRISPPSKRAISRLIDRPRPVPPYLRLVV